MTVKIEISEELEAYFSKRETHAAVDFIVEGADSNWTELSFKEFETSDISEYKNYSDAWLYATKVQKDYFDFMSKLWAASWGKMVSENLTQFLQVTNFENVESVWAEKFWHRKYEPKKETIFDSVWLYCKCKETREAYKKISLLISLGQGDEYEMDDIAKPSSEWNKITEKGEDYFVRDCLLMISENECEVSDIKTAMQEAKSFFLKEVFKS